MKEAKKISQNGEEKMDNTLEQTVKRIERLNRILTVAVVVEALVLVLFL
jgi:CHASE3 domain sensor protein